MGKRERARLELRSRVFKALAHPARLFFVEVLSQRERCVCELAEMTGVDVSTASRHLALLRQAGIISAEKRGAGVHYRLRMRCVLGFLECVEAELIAAAKERLRLARAGARSKLSSSGTTGVKSRR